MTLKAQATKAKVDKWDYINLKCLWSKGNNRVRKPTVWENILANHISDKRSISRTHKELLQLKKEKSPI